MADLERKVEKLDERVTSLERQVSNVTIKVDALSEKIDLVVTEMRDRDNQRAEDMREIRQDIKNMQNRIDDMGKHVRNLSLTAMGAIATMVVTVIISLLRSL